MALARNFDECNSRLMYGIVTSLLYFHIHIYCDFTVPDHITNFLWIVSEYLIKEIQNIHILQCIVTPRSSKIVLKTYLKRIEYLPYQ